MKIREYRAEDKNRIIAVLRLNTPAFFSPSEEDDLIFYLDNYAQNYFVVEVDGVIEACGGFNLSDDGEIGKISWDIVNPQCQGKGIGTALTQYRIDKLKNMEGIKIISARTSQHVFKFYEKFGLELREIIKDYWAEGFDLYRLDNEIQLLKP